MRMRGIPTLKRYFSRSYNLTKRNAFECIQTTASINKTRMHFAEQLWYYFRVTLPKNTLPVEETAGGHSVDTSSLAALYSHSPLQLEKSILKCL